MPEPMLTLAPLIRMLYILIGITLVVHIISAIGLYSMAIKRNIENAWFVWIPILQMYIMGKLVMKFKIVNFEIQQPEIILPITGIAVGLGNLASVVGTIIYFFALYRLFCLYKPDKAQIYTILSIVLPFMGAIFIFILRNEEAKLEVI